MTLCAKDVMGTKIRSVDPDLLLPDLERALLEARRSGLPVVKNGRLVGVVSQADIVRKLATEQSYAEYISDYYRDIGGYEDTQSGESLSQMAARVGTRLGSIRVRDVMSQTPVTVSPEDPVSRVAQLMVEHQFHRIPVTRDGQLVGIITSLDLVRLLAEESAAPA